MTLQGQSQDKYNDRYQFYCYDLQKLTYTFMNMGITLKQLAKIVEIKYGNSAVKYVEICHILSGRRKFPNPAWVKQLADILNVPMSEVVKPTPTKSDQ